MWSVAEGTGTLHDEARKLLAWRIPSASMSRSRVRHTPNPATARRMITSGRRRRPAMTRVEQPTSPSPAVRRWPEHTPLSSRPPLGRLRLRVPGGRQSRPCHRRGSSRRNRPTIRPSIGAGRGRRCDADRPVRAPGRVSFCDAGDVRLDATDAGDAAGDAPARAADAPSDSVSDTGRRGARVEGPPRSLAATLARPRGAGVRTEGDAPFAGRQLSTSPTAARRSA